MEDEEKGEKLSIIITLILFVENIFKLFSVLYKYNTIHTIQPALTLKDFDHFRLQILAFIVQNYRYRVRLEICQHLHQP